MYAACRQGALARRAVSSQVCVTLRCSSRLLATIWRAAESSAHNTCSDFGFPAGRPERRVGLPWQDTHLVPLTSRRPLAAGHLSAAAQDAVLPACVGCSSRKHTEF